MSNPTAYITVAAIYALREYDYSTLPDTREELMEAVQKKYGWKIESDTVDKIIGQLEEWGGAAVFKDRYAGVTLKLTSAKSDELLDRIHESGHQALLSQANTGGTPWFKRVFENTSFWEDLSKDTVVVAENVESSAADAGSNIVPASDRIVTIAHNSPEGEVLTETVTIIVDNLDTNNEVATTAGGDRDRLLAEGRASLEVLKGESVRKSNLIELLWKFLKEVMSKFKEKAIEWGVDKALAVLDNMLDLLK